MEKYLLNTFNTENIYFIGHCYQPFTAGYQGRLSIGNKLIFQYLMVFG